MKNIDTNLMSQSSILLIYSEKDDILINPEYQRNGDVWSTEKKQLLIDSILNKYDIPKIYFHVIDKSQNEEYKYAVIDGRQRLEAIWQFIENKFPLANDIDYLDDSKIDLRGMYYKDIANAYQKVKIRFDGYVLPIVEVKVNDLELIDDMFSRLNEAVPLNAAEKRNAIGGDMAKAIRDIAKHELYKGKICFNNNRYQYYESSAKLLLLEDSLQKIGRVIDTKKIYLDRMVTEYRNSKPTKVKSLVSKVTKILDKMNEIFSYKDTLLKAQSSIPVYYLFFRYIIEKDLNIKNLRKKFLDFNESVKNNRTIAEDDISKAEFALLEYSRLSIQGTNDASSIKERLEILINKICL